MTVTDPTDLSIADGLDVARQIAAEHPKLAILGFTNHREHAFDLGPEFALWGLNELYRYSPIEKFHAWFEIHPLDGADWGEDHLKQIGAMRMPVFMQARHPDVPASVPFPRQQIVDAFPDGGYQTSTISWELALGILAGFEEIHLYGVDLVHASEYAKERPAVEYWLGYARGKGIRVVVPPESDVLACVGEYGYGGGDRFSLRLRKRLEFLEHEHGVRIKRMKQLEEEASRVETEAHQFLGGMQDVRLWIRSWSLPQATQDGRFNPSSSQRAEDPHVQAERLPIEQMPSGVAAESEKP